MLRTFFRIVSANPPGVNDFCSNQELGLPLLDPDPVKQEMWRGVSVFATLSQARNKARNYPGLGRYIAILEIDDAGPIRVARTGLGRGHHTVWADTESLLRCVVAVVHVSFESASPADEGERP
jgi:hypothetical protein